MKTMVPTTLIAAMALACCGVASAGTTLVQDVRVFDGANAYEHRSVLLRDGTIADADFHGPAPAGARVVAGAGRTLLPGLIDAHVHAFQHLDLPLLFGVTTQVDMFTPVAVMQEVSRAMAAGRNGDQADLFSAGTLVTAPGGHGTEFPVPIPTLAAAIRQVHAGGRAIAPELALESWSAGQDPLSERERQVLRLAGEGKTGAEIARLVHLSEGTVRNYLSEAISKLGAANRIEAYRAARNAGWL